jgi:hypothetical protein
MPSQKYRGHHVTETLNSRNYTRIMFIVGVTYVNLSQSRYRQHYALSSINPCSFRDIFKPAWRMEVAATWVFGKQ